MKELLCVLIPCTHRARSVVGLTSRKRFRACEQYAAALKGHHIEEAGVGIIRRRKPVCGSINVRADIRAFLRWYSARRYSATGRVDIRGPVKLLHEGSRVQKLTTAAIEHVEKAVTVSLH